jgi:hypothetical protein
MWAQKTQDEDKQTTIKKSKKIRNTNPTKKPVINKKWPTFSIFQIHSSMCIVYIQLTYVQISIKKNHKLKEKRKKKKKKTYIFYISASQFNVYCMYSTNKCTDFNKNITN